VAINGGRLVELRRDWPFLSWQRMGRGAFLSVGVLTQRTSVALDRHLPPFRFGSSWRSLVT
jgi:hypothetical protein